MTTINEIATCVPFVGQLDSNQLPFLFNDTITAENSIYFGFNLTYLNSLRQSVGLSAISSSDLNSGLWGLTVFLCDSINGSNNFVNVRTSKTYSLNSTNLSNGFVSQILSGYNNSIPFNHEDLCDIASEDEVKQLCKEFKIIFRFNLLSNLNTSTTTQNGDIVNNLLLMFDLNDSGPYDVTMENIDMMSNSDFTVSELLQITNENYSIFGGANLRCCYPKNYKNLSALPLLLICHGNNHNQCMYDAYLQFMASYGYFALSVMRETGAKKTSGVDGTGSINSQAVCILSHFKKYISKIKNGAFNNHINFNEILLAGHSMGGGATLEIYSDIAAYPDSYTPVIPGLTASDIKGWISLDGGGSPTSYVATGTSKLLSYDFPVFNTCNSSQDFEGLPNLPVRKTIYGINEKYIDGGVQTTQSTHEDVAETFAVNNSGPQSPPLIMNNQAYPTLVSQNATLNYTSKIPKNNKAKQRAMIIAHALKIFKLNEKQKIINHFKSNTKKIKPESIENTEYTLCEYLRMPLSGTFGISFIDSLQNVSKFTTNIASYDLLVGITYVTSAIGYDLFYSNQLMQAHTDKYYPSIYPQYCGNCFYVFQPLGTTQYINYSLISTLNLNGNSYIGIPIGLVPEYDKLVKYTEYGSLIPNLAFPTFSSEISQHFTVELQDSNSTISSLSSKQNNIGMRTSDDMCIIDYGNTYASYSGQRKGMIDCIYFRTQDFKHKNPSIDLTQIKGIKLLFGNSYGFSGFINARIGYNGIFTC